MSGITAAIVGYWIKTKQEYWCVSYRHTSFHFFFASGALLRCERYRENMVSHSSLEVLSALEWRLVEIYKIEMLKKQKKMRMAFLKEKWDTEYWLHCYMVKWFPMSLGKVHLMETRVFQAERRERRIVCHAGVCSTTMAACFILTNKTSLV